MTEKDTRRAAERVKQRFGLELFPEETLVQVYIRHWIVFARRSWWLGVVMGLVLIVGRWLIAGLIREETGALAPTLLLGGILAIACTVLIVFYMDWRNDALIHTDQRIIHVERVILLFQSQEEVSLDNVQTINTSVRGFLARIIGYGNIYVDTAARGTDIVFGPTPNPRAAQREIMAQVRALQEAATTRLMQQTLLHRLDPKVHDAPAIPTSSEEKKVSSGLGHWLSFFIPANPRSEGDHITWHKHHIFLLRRLLFPLLLLLTLIAGAFFFPPVGRAQVLWIGWVSVLAFALMFTVTNYQLWVGDIYVVTLDTILDINRTPFGLFGESRRTANLERIQNITYQQPGFMANLLNFGDVRIQTAGEEDFTFDHVPHPAKVQREINRRQGLQRMRSEQQEREEIADWLVTFWKLTQDLPED